MRSHSAGYRVSAPTVCLIERPSSRTVLWLSAVVIFCCAPLNAQQTVSLSGTPYAVQNGTAKLVGHYDPRQMLRLVLALQPPHLDEEESFLRTLQDPKSPQFHQFLSEAEWDARFAPTSESEQAVVQWAQSQGLTITQRYPNRLLVDVEAPVATIEKAFKIAINAYQLGSESHFSNDRDPSVPAALVNVVGAVLGLNNIEVMRSASGKDLKYFPVYSPGPANSQGSQLQSEGNRGTLDAAMTSGRKQSGTYGAFDPYFPPLLYSSYAYNYGALQSLAHCCNPLNNPNNSPPEASIAIAIAGDFRDSDLQGWLSDNPFLASNVQRHYVDGTPPCCSGEATLDVEWSTAMANSFSSPANTAEIHMYEGVNDYLSTYLDVINQALSDGQARVLSMSWGGAEFYNNNRQSMAAYHSVFNQMVGQGWSLVAASGDNGSTTGCADYVAVSHPASDPDVTAVGGTSLSTLLNQYFSETTWSWEPGTYGCSDNNGGSGGGCSAYFANPGYQGVVACSGNMRTMPDIALNSDFVNEPEFFFYNGQLYLTGGTSIATPQIAGFYAQENAYLLFIQSVIGDTCGPSFSAACAPMGSANPFIYNEGIYQTAPHYPFYDITSGCNNNDNTQRYGLQYFCAGPGYDRVTGWGSANMLQFAWMINYALAGDGGGPTASFSGPQLNHWYKTDQTVSWTLTDTGGNGHLPNGVVGSSSAWDADPGDPYSQPTPGAGNNYYGPQSYGLNGQMSGLAQLSQGCHNSFVRGWDNAGNSSLSAYGPVCFDSLPPVTTITLTGNGQNGNYNGPVLVSVGATDNASGVAATYFVVNSGQFLPYTGPVYAYLPGYNQATAYSVDVAGNIEQLEFLGFDIQQNQQFTVAVHKSGTGSGTVTSSDGLINCGTTCSAPYYLEQPMTLTASAAPGSVFLGWRGCDQSFGLTCTATILSARTVHAEFSVPVALQFVPVTPCRLIDTRGPIGEFGAPPLRGGEQRDFRLPQGPCPNIPSTVAAYALNITVVPHGSLNYLAAWPTGLTRPTISTLNSYDGRVKANAAILPAGDLQAISLYGTDTTDVIVDINGYFIPSTASTLAFFPLTPCRVVDTRGTNGPLGGPYLMNQQTRDFPVLQATSCHIPSTAQAYSLNVTALPRQHANLGYLTVWPNGQTMPGVSTLNAPTGTVTANASIVPAGTNGDIEVYPYGADTDLLIDIDGYFAPAGSGSHPLSLYAFAPCRVLDTRGGDGAFQGELTVNVVAGSCQAPAEAQAFVMNATVVPLTRLQYLTLWPDGQPQPVVSTLNAYDGAVTSNMAIVPTTNGSIDAYTSDLTQLLLDISSYFGP